MVLAIPIHLPFWCKHIHTPPLTATHTVHGHTSYTHCYTCVTSAHTTLSTYATHYTYYTQAQACNIHCTLLHTLHTATHTAHCYTHTHTLHTATHTHNVRRHGLVTHTRQAPSHASTPSASYLPHSSSPPLCHPAKPCPSSPSHVEPMSWPTAAVFPSVGV